MQDEDI